MELVEDVETVLALSQLFRNPTQDENPVLELSGSEEFDVLSIKVKLKIHHLILLLLAGGCDQSSGQIKHPLANRAGGSAKENQTR